MIRKAKKEDLNGILEVINMGKRLHVAIGLDQWNLNSPSDESIIDSLSHFYVNEIDNTIVGVMALTIGEDKDYSSILGEWLIDSHNYLTIHRLAVNSNFYHKGVASSMIEYALNFASINHLDSVRIDTHEFNERMMGLIAKYNFKRCGIVHIDGNLRRIGFERVINY